MFSTNVCVLVIFAYLDFNAIFESMNTVVVVVSKQTYVYIRSTDLIIDPYL